MTYLAWSGYRTATRLEGNTYYLFVSMPQHELYQQVRSTRPLADRVVTAWSPCADRACWPRADQALTACLPCGGRAVAVRRPRLLTARRAGRVWPSVRAATC